MGRNFISEGVVRCRVRDLQIGQRVDLENDPWADPLGDNPGFPYEYETVAAIEVETDQCTRVDFESGYSCGFPPLHIVDVDGEQIIGD